MNTVVRFEWRMLRAERALWLAVLVLAIAVFLAARDGRQWTASQRAATESASRLDRATVDSIHALLVARAGDSTPIAAFGDARSAYTAGATAARRWVTLASLPLAPLATGQSDLFTSYYRVSMLTRETLYANDELENPANLLAGRLDLAFVVIFLYPLLVIALAYNMLSLERERGTLRLLLAQPIHLRTLLLGKVAARATVLVAVAVVLVVVGAASGGAAVATPSTWPALLACVTVVVAYGLLWFALALFVNVLGRSSSANALILLAAWLVAVVLVPSGLAATVAAWAPAPSRIELVQAQRHASDRATARAATALSAFMQDHPELAPSGQPVDAANVSLRNLAVQDDILRATMPVTEHYNRQLARQQSAVERLRVLSPALVAHDALTALAGTDAARYRRFGASADAYAGDLRGFFAPMIVRGAPFTAADVARMPAFSWRDDTDATRVARAALDSLLLLCFAAVMGIAALTLSRHVDVLS